MRQPTIYIPQVDTHTTGSLEAHNRSYNQEHGIKGRDAQIANHITDLLREKVKSNTPEIGDRIILEGYNSYDKKDVVYDDGIIESLNAYKTGKLYACCNGSPYIYNTGNLSVSGGYFLTIDPSKVEFVGYSTRFFWTFGWNGACGNGGIYFEAPVKVWRYKNNEEIY